MQDLLGASDNSILRNLTYQHDANIFISAKDHSSRSGSYYGGHCLDASLVTN